MPFVIFNCHACQYSGNKGNMDTCRDGNGCSLLRWPGTLNNCVDLFEKGDEKGYFYRWHRATDATIRKEYARLIRNLMKEALLRLEEEV